MTENGGPEKGGAKWAEDQAEVFYRLFNEAKSVGDSEVLPHLTTQLAIWSVGLSVLRKLEAIEARLETIEGARER